MSITGNQGEEPQKVGVAVTDLMTGVYATTAILAALHERARTGHGRVIDAALFDVQVAMLANQASNQLIGNKTPTRMGNAHPNIVPYQVFPTRDGHMVLAVGNDGQFAKFCDAAGQPAVSRDARYSTNPARVEHRHHAGAADHRLDDERDTAEWVALLDQAGVPCARFLTSRRSWNIRTSWRAAMALKPLERADPAHGRQPHAVRWSATGRRAVAAGARRRSGTLVACLHLMCTQGFDAPLFR
jgi:crotonobetainyl-CoA:carnitine CoA-transferase CaiB-like acyl-CoA transferase